MATNPSNVWSPEIVAALADERVFKDTGVLSAGTYILDARASATYDGASNSIKVPYTTDSGLTQRKVQTNTVNGSAVTPDTIKLTTASVNLKRGIYNVESDNAALRNLANSVDPDTFMADSFANYMRETVLGEVFSTLDAEATNVKDITGEETYHDLSLALVKKQATVYFGERARKASPLVILHSDVMLDIENDSSVVTALNHGARPDGAPFLNLANFNWAVSDMATVATEETPDEYNSYLLLPGAVSVYVKIDEELFGDTVRVKGTSSMDTVFPFDYAVYINKMGVVPVGKITSLASIND